MIEGRYPGFDHEIRAEGQRIASTLDAGLRWWNEGWADWRPDPGWPIPTLAERWDTYR